MLTMHIQTHIGALQVAYFLGLVSVVLIILGKYWEHLGERNYNIYGDDLRKLANILRHQANCEHKNKMQTRGLSFNYGIGIVCSSCAKELYEEESVLYEKLFNDDGDRIDVKFLQEKHEIVERFMDQLVDGHKKQEKLELKNKVDSLISKKVKKHMPRIYRLALYAILVMFVWKIYSNAEVIISWLIGKI